MWNWCLRWGTVKPWFIEKIERRLDSLACPLPAATLELISFARGWPKNSSIFDLPVLGPWRRNKRTKMYGLRTWLTTKRYHLLESRNVRTMICQHMRNKTIHAMSDKCAHGFSIFVSILWPLGLRQFATVCYLVKSALPQDDITAVVPEIVDPDAISPKDAKDAEACPDNLLG